MPTSSTRWLRVGRVMQLTLEGWQAPPSSP